MQTNPAVEQSKIIRCLVHGTNPVGKEKVCGGKDLLKRQQYVSEIKRSSD